MVNHPLEDTRNEIGLPRLDLRRIRRGGMAAGLLVALIGLQGQAQDLHIKKNVSVGGIFISTTDTSIKGARERSVNQGPGGNTVTLRQCDARRTLILNEQAQTYLVSNDPQDENAAKSAAIATGVPETVSPGGKITMTATVTDTGERKQMYGYEARHLKVKVVEEPSPDACTRTRQSFDIDGWYADVAKEQAACTQFVPPVQQGAGCHDSVILRRAGSGRPGYPLQENITMPTPDGATVTVTTQVSELTKQQLPSELFDVPAGYTQVNSLAELNAAIQPQPGISPRPAPAKSLDPSAIARQAQNAKTPAEQAALGQQAAWAQAAQVGLTPTGMPNTSGMPGMGGGQPAGAAVTAPQALGPKAPGKIRVGVAPPDAQVGQGSNAGADYSTPIRNAEIALMSGPAIEIAALDSRVAMQLQAEAQQKQCDYILFSSVTVKRTTGGFGRLMKMAAPVAGVVPMVGMAKGAGAAAAAQAAGQPRRQRPCRLSNRP